MTATGGLASASNVAPRILRPAPSSFLDPVSKAPLLGSYAGPLPRVDLANVNEAPAWRALRRKRWLYVAIAGKDVFVALAIVHTGFAATAFVFVYDAEREELLADRTSLGAPPFAALSDDPHADGPLATFSFGKTRASVVRGGPELRVDASFGDVSLDAIVDEADAATPIAAISRFGEGLVSGTEKLSVAGVRGHVRVGGRSFSLDGALAGWDYTQGFLPRHTAWRWAFGIGRTSTGEAIGFNAVEGFVGDAECAIFHRGDVHPIAAPSFVFDRARIRDPWQIRGEGIDLVFRPGGAHEQFMNLGVVRSRFVQPVGAFEGTLRVAGEDIAVSRILGVVEDQDVLW